MATYYDIWCIFLLILIYAHEIFLLPIGERHMPESYIDTMKQSQKMKFSRNSEIFCDLFTLNMNIKWSKVFKAIRFCSYELNYNQ